MDMMIRWIPRANDRVQTTWVKVGEQRIFTFTVDGQEEDRHFIQPFPLAGDYEDIMQWTLRGPGGASGPKLWRKIAKSPPCRMIIGESIYSNFMGNLTLEVVGVQNGQTYAFCGVKAPNTEEYTGTQGGNSVVELNNGAG
jgi:hypothetical protein